MFFHYVFEVLDCKVEYLVAEGYEFAPDQPGERIAVATVSGYPERILQGERLALNILARCSGIATRARRYLLIKEQHNFLGVIAGTRKTTPGFRLVEKYGLLIGGVDTHRMDLSSATMLKDNHLALLKGPDELVSTVKRLSPITGFTNVIEIECKTEEEAENSILGGARIVMLDNLCPTELKRIAMNIKSKHPHIIIEASGGVSEDTLSSYFSPHVDVISCGSLTQGVPIVDFSLKIEKKSSS